MKAQGTKFRFHRGGLKESMQTVIEFSDRDDLIKKIIDGYPTILFEDKNFECIPYGGIDERIGWDTYLIIMDGIPMGMTDGPV